MTTTFSSFASSGHIVSQASSSQYGWEGGQSACTAICLMAAQGLLELNPSEWTSVPSILMDLWVQQGVAKFNLLRSAGGGSFDSHASVEDLWPNSVFADLTESHVRATTIQGSVAVAGNLQQAFQRVLLNVTGQSNLAMSPPPDAVAVVWTKSGETVLCLGTTPSFQQRCPASPPFWYLFDSHGLSHSSSKVATLRAFGDLDELLYFLQGKYPALVMGNVSMQEDMYNLFEVYPIVRKHCITEATGHDLNHVGREGTSQHTESSPKSFNQAVEQPTNKMEDWIRSLLSPVSPVARPQQQKPPQPNQATPRPCNSSSPQDQAEEVNETPQHTSTTASSSPIIRRSDYEDTITYQIMADPVSCDDGHSYDRPVIERCFRDRIAAEEARLRGSNQPGHDATNCCGANRAPIELVSPISNKVVSGNLIPNLFLEQQIVRLMESNHFNMSAEDIADWRRRREEKRVSDRQREEAERQERIRAEERRRNAEEAEARNRHRNNILETPPIPPPAQESMPSLTSVRLVRDTSDPNQRQSNMDTGLAVVVGESGVVIPELFTQLGREVRCMVDRCARRLDGAAADRRCARCARLVCGECLAFDVSNLARLSVDHRLHTVCLDCMSQIVDCMDPNANSRLGQRRAALSRELESHMARLTNRASVLQDQILRLDATLRNAPQIVQRDREIAQLKETLVDLYSQINETNRRAETAKNATPVSSDVVDDKEVSASRQPDPSTTTHITRPVQELRVLFEELEKEFAEALMGTAGDNEEEQIRYTENISSLSARLEKASLDLAMASSSNSVQTIEQTEVGSDSSSATNRINDLRASCQSLEAEFLAAVAAIPGDNDDEATQTHYIETMSSLEHQLEQARMNLAMAESTAQCANSNTGAAVKSAGANQEEKPLITGVLDFINDILKEVANGGKGTSSSTRENAPELLSQSNVSPPTCPIPVGPLNAIASSSNGVKVARETAGTSDTCSQTLLFIQRVERLLEAKKRRLRTVFFGKKKKQQVKARSKWFDDLRWAYAAAAASPFDSEQHQQTLVTLRSKLDCAKGFLPFDKASQMGWEAARAEVDAIGSTVGQLSSQQIPNDYLDKESPGYWEKKDLLAITQDTAGPSSSMVHIQLPLGLEFPTQRTRRQLEILRNTLALRRVESEQTVELEWAAYWTARDGEVDALEKAITEARQQLSTSESTAREEEKRAREREEERRRREEERHAREEARRAEQERAERERAMLQERLRQDEAATEQLFAEAASRANSQGATALGGRGDLRMCGRCKAGPIENKACADLDAHNDAGTRYKGTAVASKASPNACPHCGWFNGDWRNWPYWDGKFGPHE